MIVDTHIHLDDARYVEDLDAVLERAREVGVTRYIIPAADPDTLPRAVALADQYEAIYFAVGVHPDEAARYDRAKHECFIEHPKCVAVGEIGLDYYRLPEDPKEAEQITKLQQDVLVDQMDLANTYGKPIIVHIRDASRDAQALLEAHAGAQGGVLHCFNADHELLTLAERGFYYGIGGVLTFKNARKLVEVFPRIPEDRLLIETDGPYLTPHPYRGERNEPAYCALIAEKMADLSGIPLAAMQGMCRDNTTRLFGI